MTGACICLLTRVIALLSQFVSSQCCERDLRKEIEILAKLVFPFFIIAFNMMKLLVILFIIKRIAHINIFQLIAYVISLVQLNCFNVSHNLQGV